MILRKKIYIGETSQGVIYYDTQTGEILAANKSNLLNTEKSGQKQLKTVHPEAFLFNDHRPINYYSSLDS
ncbi:TPA: hypothetical protein VA023_001431 [Streptococcus agalactiae]|nr:hypothetical protein [Streptococcus agalactiae]